MTQRLIQLLCDGNHSLVIENSDGIRTFDGHGITDLYKLLRESPEQLKGATIVDKVIGKAAAALMILGGANNVFAQVISEQALKLFETSPITVGYDKKVQHIINRTNTGWCPMEIRCIDCVTADECLTEIELFLNEIKKRQTDK